MGNNRLKNQNDTDITVPSLVTYSHIVQYARFIIKSFLFSCHNLYINLVLTIKKLTSGYGVISGYDMLALITAKATESPLS